MRRGLGLLLGVLLVLAVWPGTSRAADVRYTVIAEERLGTGIEGLDILRKVERAEKKGEAGIHDTFTGIRITLQGIYFRLLQWEYHHEQLGIQRPPDHQLPGSQRLV